ncbi:hypothetical protein VCR4J5_770062 [Vibrio crassostreae]|uniref:Uncharacterized protein n=1 Tax=Vibrio crassostreae TaxID=246167 RepID=A0ABP1X058_9VIBR|nr:hypothetical protein VCR20J5_1010006 [Vibrio crassostreae]CDT27171.1 hypothetical protein VCR19J5_180006 [Vibrio crassostreae]CDT65541.1 hypothetical protein VCR4J5_770062 [Vibrio crassostreae]
MKRFLDKFEQVVSKYEQASQNHVSYFYDHNYGGLLVYPRTTNQRRMAKSPKSAFTDRKLSSVRQARLHFPRATPKPQFHLEAFSKSESIKAYDFSRSNRIEPNHCSIRCKSRDL